MGEQAAAPSIVEYEEDNMALFDEDAPLRLCKHQLEHEGGRFWCNLPIGHAGPHEPPPHEAEGYSVQKRQRAPPKRLSDDVPEPKEKRPRLKPKSDTEDHARSDSDDAGSGGGGGATPLHRSHKKKAASRSGAGSRQPQPNAQPIGFLTQEQEDHRKQHCSATALAELQNKLPEEMRSAGWLVLPKGVNSMETGHFFVCFADMHAHTL